MRWADLDPLGHVNNVRYLNYLREARVDFFAALGHDIDVDDLAESVRVIHNQVVFAAPLLFRQRPITIELWVSDIGANTFALNYEIVDETDRGRVVHVRARAELQPWMVNAGEPRALTASERAQLEPYLEGPIEFSSMASPPDHHLLPSKYDLTVRLSDLDIYRRVSDVIYFEYFQEARVAYLFELMKRAAESQQFVIARTDITYHSPLMLRREPYAVRSGVVAVGNTSFTVVARIYDGDTVAATAQVVLVGFDATAQVAAPLPQPQREVLLGELSA